MEYISSLSLGCKSKRSVKPNSSHTIVLNPYHMHSYGYLMMSFSEVFFRAQYIQENNYSNEPYRLAVLVPSIEKCKEEDAEDNLTRYKFILNNYQPPKNGIQITFWKIDYKEKKRKIIEPILISYIWSWKDKWDKNNCKDYVVVNDLHDVKNHSKHKGTVQVYERLIESLDMMNVDYRTVNYTTPIEQMYNLLLNSKLCISMPGTSHYISGPMGLPTLCYGDSYWTRTNKYVKYSISGQPMHKKMLSTVWGKSAMSEHSILHLDENGINEKPVDFVTNIGELKTKEDYEILRNAIFKL